VSVLGVLAVAIALEARPAAAAPLSPEAMQQWTKALVAYVQDPMGQRAELRRLARRHGTDGLPVPVLMALADVNLRSSRERAAAEMFETVLAQSPGQPWTGWAEMALGSIATRRGDDAAAREHFRRAAEPGSPSQAMALVTLGMADARVGEVPLALERFEAVERAPNATRLIRQAARLGAAYARYWSGDHAAAARAFDAVVASDPTGPLADDARYGAARARWAAGERTEAGRLFEALAGDRSGASGPVSRRLVDLEPDAVFRAGFDRYRRSPFKPGDDIVASSFDGDGVALARAALRLLDPAAPPEPPMVGPGSRLATTFTRAGARDAPAAPPPDAGRAVRHPAPVVEGPIARPTGTRAVWVVALVAALVAALLARGGARRRRASRSPRG